MISLQHIQLYLSTCWCPNSQGAAGIPGREGLDGQKVSLSSSMPELSYVQFWDLFNSVGNLQGKTGRIGTPGCKGDPGDKVSPLTWSSISPNMSEHPLQSWLCVWLTARNALFLSLKGPEWFCWRCWWSWRPWWGRIKGLSEMLDILHSP